MEDKILDDDDIIDLTDLLEEGEPKQGKGKKEAGAPERTSANEPDSFDLGKEISMEYDVSVEEIEQGGESLDIDASLSSREEVALSPEKGEGEEAILSQEPEGEIEFDFDDAKGPDRTESSSKKKQAGFSHNANDDMAVISEGEISDAAVDLDAGESDRESPSEHAAGEEAPPEPAGDFEDAALSPEEQEPVAEKAGLKISGEIDLEAIPPAMQSLAAGDTLDELKKEIPAMVEGIVRPLMTELVHELIVSTREQLPGIVEKVIREEIEKLKKLDS